MVYENKPYDCPTRRQFLKHTLYGVSTIAPLVLSGLSGCRKHYAKVPNILLISIDTLRADHLGCYGYHRKTSPNIDKFANSSLLYSNAFAPSSWTLPSHAGMLTGLHPYTYGMHSRNSVIPPDVTIVSELLKTRGYRTAGFVDSWPKGFVGGERGFSRGFDTYSYVPLIKNIKLMSKRLYHDMAATVEVAEKWITKRNPDRPFFLFMHTKSVHSASTKNTDKRDAFRFPYDKPEPYRSLFLTPQQLTMRWDPPYTEYLEHYCKELSTGRSDYKKFPRDRIDALIGQYDSGIVYTDEYIGNLLKFIEDIGLLDNSVIIITSDHGEAFLEHRLFAHKELYSQLLHVPVIMKLPWMKKGEIIDTPVSLVDIVPTLLNYIGLSSPEKLDGSPFPDSRSDKQPGRPFYGDYLYNKDAPYQGFSLQKDDKKIIYHKYDNTDWHLESYNMSTDPKEQEPLSSEHIQLKKELFRWINKKPRTKSKEIELDKETIEHLKSLGYV